VLRLRLADDIVTGVLEPGAPLDEMELARRFGVSRTPVREAIRDLAASGLVVTRAHRGASVAHPTPGRLDDMFQAMGELEALCAGLCALHMTAAEQAALQELHDEMGRMAERGEADRYTPANEEFHNALYVGTHNAYLAEIALQTRTRVQPFRRAQFRAAGRLRLSHEEHDRVVQAIKAGDRAAASDAMRAHIGTVHDAYVRYAIKM
jgi:DNA-binding GntR family transcriptional regulator